MDTTYSIAVVPGDGIGQEVVPAAVHVLDVAAERFGFAFDWRAYQWGCDHYVRTGRMMPTDGLERLREHDAIFLGAVGRPDVPDHVSLWGLLIPIRRAFRQYVNLRPARLLPGVTSPLARPADIDLMVVRENNEGEYSEIGGRLYRGLPEEMAVQEAVFTRCGTERVMRYAFDLARSRKGRLTSATKSNGIIHTMPFWDEVCEDVARDYPDVSVRRVLIDALAAGLVRDPGDFDVIVASNLFGDIVSDLTAALSGSLGLAPSANLNPEGDTPSMFEPVHGSAPDIAGRGVANPLAQIWTGAMMLDHLGQPQAARLVTDALEDVLASAEVHTPDLGGEATTERVVDAVTDRLRRA
ncbi:MAG: tartrate dehydrogenase [Streptosporangiaceae bacterium]